MCVVDNVRLLTLNLIPIGQAQLRPIGFNKHKCEQPPLLLLQLLINKIY